MAALGGAFAALQFNLRKLFHQIPPKNVNALKLGVLSTAAINAMAIIYPSKTHPDVIMYAVASRDAERAAEFAKKYGFQKSHGSYQALLDDPEVDIVYIPTPNSLHYEWASKALDAGKHVLLEKPITSNAEEAEMLLEQASGRNLVLLEAFHWRFHPATTVFAELLQKYGAEEGPVSINAHMKIFPVPPDEDIRWNFDLAGGSLMDCAYALSFVRFAVDILQVGSVSSSSLEVVEAEANPWKNDSQVDAAMHAILKSNSPRQQADQETQNDATQTITCDISTDMAGQNVYRLLGFIPIPRYWDLPSITVTFGSHEVSYYNAIAPHAYHSISVRDKAGKVVESRQSYAGGPAWSGTSTTESEKLAGGKGGLKGWSTYRYQLEAFVKKVQGEEPPVWISAKDSLQQMEGIDAIYRAAGLPVRKSSSYVKQRAPVQASP